MILKDIKVLMGKLGLDFPTKITTKRAETKIVAALEEDGLPEDIELTEAEEAYLQEQGFSFADDDSMEEDTDMETENTDVPNDEDGEGEDEEVAEEEEEGDDNGDDEDDMDEEEAPAKEKKKKPAKEKKPAKKKQPVKDKFGTRLNTQASLINETIEELDKPTVDSVCEVTELSKGRVRLHIKWMITNEVAELQGDVIVPTV